MSVRAASWLGVVSVLACGSASPTPEAPVTAAAPSTEERPSARAETPTAASDADITAILQLVVDDPELDKYLRLGEKGRFPLQISGKSLPTGLKLVKSTEPVKVVTGPQSKTDAVLVITDLEVLGDKATVRYRYDVEGIRGTVTAARAVQGWELKSSRIVER